MAKAVLTMLSMCGKMLRRVIVRTARRVKQSGWPTWTSFELRRNSSYCHDEANWVDANAVIMHGRAFLGRVHAVVHDGKIIVLPHSVKRELGNDVLVSTAKRFCV